MGWAKALFGRLTTMWSSPKKSSSEPSSSSSSTAGVPELTLRELNKATRSFSAAMLMSRGQKRRHHTAVYRASLPVGKNNDGKPKQVAAVAKRLGHPSPAATWSASDDESLRQQVLVLSRLRHDNVVRLLGYTIDTTASVRVLLFEFADMGTLHDALHGPPPGEPSSSRPALSWAQRAGIALDVARGLEYLHAAAVTHGGISSTKVLLFQGFRAKIGDYDLLLKLQGVGSEARFTNRLHTAEKTWYIPPEYIVMGHRRNPAFDVYSYGVVLLELLTGKKRWAATKTLPTPLQWAPPLVREGRVEGIMDPKLGTQYPPGRALKLARIALCCVQKDPKSRPSMATVAQMISCHIASSEPERPPWPSRLGEPNLPAAVRGDSAGRRPAAKMLATRKDAGEAR